MGTAPRGAMHSFCWKLTLSTGRQCRERDADTGRPLGGIQSLRYIWNFYNIRFKMPLFQCELTLRDASEITINFKSQDDGRFANGPATVIGI